MCIKLETKKKEMQEHITFLSDALFKYLIGRKNDEHCMKLVDFLIENIVGFKISNLRITSSEMIPTHLLQKKTILDVLLENDDYVINFEMENHQLDLYTCNRFEIYGANTTAQAQIKGDDYAKARKVLTIIFINDIFEGSTKLIEKMSTGSENKENHILSGQQCHWKYFVQLPMIVEIIKEKTRVSEFEAWVHLISQQHIEGIHYESEKGMVEMTKQMKAEFIREEPELYEAAIERDKIKTINFEAFAESQAIEYWRRKWKKEWRKEWKREWDKEEEKEREKIRQKMKEESDLREKEIQEIQDKANTKIALETQKNIDEGEKKALIETCNILINMKYKRKRNSWLKRCTIDELKKVILYTQEKDNDDYDEMINSIFSKNTGFVNGR